LGLERKVHALGLTSGPEKAAQAAAFGDTAADQGQEGREMALLKA
jgi:hypothetical protein